MSNPKDNTNEAQHTPGPWWIADDGFVAAGPRTKHQTIADCGFIGHHAGGFANARLIAAAPSLLAACDYVEGAAEGIDDSDDDALVEVVLTGKGLRDLRSAIAAAR